MALLGQAGLYDLETWTYFGDHTLLRVHSVERFVQGMHSVRALGSPMSVIHIIYGRSTVPLIMVMPDVYSTSTLTVVF